MEKARKKEGKTEEIRKEVGSTKGRKADKDEGMKIEGKKEEIKV
jgi:hypothetical protein